MAVISELPSSLTYVHVHVSPLLLQCSTTGVNWNFYDDITGLKAILFIICPWVGKHEQESWLPRSCPYSHSINLEWPICHFLLRLGLDHVQGVVVVRLIESYREIHSIQLLTQCRDIIGTEGRDRPLFLDLRDRSSLYLAFSDIYCTYPPTAEHSETDTNRWKMH